MVTSWPKPLPVTVDDLLHRLEGIPASRIRLQPPPGTATEQDVLEVHRRENRLCELVEGVLVEKVMGYYESRLAAVLIHFIESFLDDHPLGIVAAPDGMMRIAAGMVRIPDVSFVCWERLPGHEVPRTPIPNLVPDLAVEVLSEGNTPEEMARKRREYFSAGTRLAWFVDPDTRTIEVYTAPESGTVMSEVDTVTGGEVLAGFAMRVGDLFARAQGGTGAP